MIVGVIQQIARARLPRLKFARALLVTSLIFEGFNQTGIEPRGLGAQSIKSCRQLIILLADSFKIRPDKSQPTGGILFRKPSARNRRGSQSDAQSECLGIRETHHSTSKQL